MKSGKEKLTYLVALKKTEGSSNNGSGHSGFPLLMFFPSACILLPFMLLPLVLEAGAGEEAVNDDVGPLFVF